MTFEKLFPIWFSLILVPLPTSNNISWLLFLISIDGPNLSIFGLGVPVPKKVKFITSLANVFVVIKKIIRFRTCEVTVFYMHKIGILL